MMNKKEDGVVYVLLDAQGRGLAVKGLPYVEALQSVGLPMLSLYSAHSVYDATNERVLKWRSDRAITFKQMEPTIQLLAANPKGEFLRGRSSIVGTLVHAYTGREIDNATAVWRRVAVVDRSTGVSFPSARQLHDVIYHPDDVELATTILEKNGVTA